MRASMLLGSPCSDGWNFRAGSVTRLRAHLRRRRRTSASGLLADDRRTGSGWRAWERMRLLAVVSIRANSMPVVSCRSCDLGFHEYSQLQAETRVLVVAASASGYDSWRGAPVGCRQYRR